MRDPRDPNPHEEIWVMDHENSPVDGEYSPSTAHEYAELLSTIDGGEERAMLSEWLEHESRTFDAEAVEAFTEALAGWHEEPADWLADIYPEDELPEWARHGYWDILRQKWEDIKLGGEMYALYRDGGYWLFHCY